MNPAAFLCWMIGIGCGLLVAVHFMRAGVIGLKTGEVVNFRTRARLKGEAAKACSKELIAAGCLFLALVGSLAYLLLADIFERGFSP
jgi:hypothetical protein